MVPILPEDNLLLTLPFGGAVMKALGVSTEEVNAIVEKKRKEVLTMRGFDQEEEELALLQLGIKSKSVNATDAGAKIDTDGISDYALEKGRSSSRTEAASERRKAAAEKSPFVARVIQEVCPGSAEDEACLTPDQMQKLTDAEYDFSTAVNEASLSVEANRALALAQETAPVIDE
jgi:hypothetical protein